GDGLWYGHGSGCVYFRPATLARELTTQGVAMSALLSGACACGAIRYECSAAPLISFNCHCRDCQKTSGSAFLPLIVVPADALKITQGQPKYHAVKADSGRTISRGFCQECGSTML